MSVVTRFPPSPTGFLHIGGARTALFNWLYAKRHGGKFVLRIEDTDRARHSEEAVLAIVNSMKWLGLDWDGDVVSQYELRDRHAEVAHELLKAGKAYYCYCSKEELEQMREEAKKEGRPTVYNRKWREKSPEDAPEGVDPVIRIKAPIEGTSVIEDKVQGSVEVDNKQLDDFILLRSDGTPTYMLSVVVDDHDMGVTHVMRGDDHLNNAFRQKIIYEAMGWDVPVFAHIPLILGPDGQKLSKRHGAVSVEAYEEMGYLPEAMRNYLLRLGWSHGDHEIISTEQAIEWFNIESIGKSPAKFDFAKLDNINQHYIQQSDGPYLMDISKSIFEKRYAIVPDDSARKMILDCIDEFKDRAKTLVQFVDESVFFAKSIPYDFDEKASKTLSDEDAQEVLSALLDHFAAMKDFLPEDVEQTCRDVAEKHRDGKLGKVGMPLRAALTGRTASPSIFHIASVLGQENSCARLKYTLETFAEQKNKTASN